LSKLINKEEVSTQLREAWQYLVERVFKLENTKKSKEKDFFEEVEEARLEWHLALDYFNNVADSELVDHAIHTMEAAEKKYIYLLSKARQEGYRLPVVLDTLRAGR